MTNHTQNAIEAGARTVTPHLYYMYDEWDEATNEDRETAIEMSTQVISAALPHLRAMIAQEILEAHYDRSPNYGYSKRDISIAQEAVKDAAQIAKGPQQ